MTLTEKLQDVPSAPGIYLMKDAQGMILYVGKSKNLRQRVHSYFQNSKSHSPKVRKLVRHLKDFELVLTDTEFEAFMLECQTIKALQPPYNRKMKNPQSYTYITVQPNHFRRAMAVTVEPPAGEGRLTFGPYTSRSAAERAVQGLLETFKLQCGHPTVKEKACLNHSLGLCLGMCLGGAALLEYNRLMDRIIGLLRSSDQGILEEMGLLMQEAAERLDFESAARYRDRMDAVRYLLHQERVVGFAAEHPQVAVAEWLDEDRVKLFLLRRNAIALRQTFCMKGMEPEELVAAAVACIRSSLEAEPAGPNPHREISRYEIDEAQIIYSYLQGSSCRYVVIPEAWLAPGDTRLEEAVPGLLDKMCIPSTAVMQVSAASDDPHAVSPRRSILKHKKGCP